MVTPQPVTNVSYRPPTWGDAGQFADWPWMDLAPLSPFILADGSGPAQHQTEVRLCYDAGNLYVRYDCADQDIWGIATHRDAPIFDEEVVELFIAPSASTPIDYFEFEVSPLGTLLDLKVHSPHGNRTELQTNFAWNCPGLAWQAQRHDALHHWYAYLVIPWRSLVADVPLPKIWRANFYRIERPHTAPDEYSCWSPTYTEPADYHRPAFFGTLYLYASNLVS